MSILEAALRYAEAGAFIVPLKDPYGKDEGTAGKMPILGKKWPELSSDDPETIKGWFKKWPKSNIGVHLAKSKLCCLDIDPRNGGLKWYGYHEEELLGEFTAIAEKSGRGDGGTHIYFRVPDDPEILEKIHSTKLAPGVDFLIGNRQTVVTPSIHMLTKKPNEWLTDMTMEDCKHAGDMPDWLLDEIIAKCQSKVSVETVALDLANAKEIRESEREQLKEELERLDPEAGRHNSIGAWIINAIACNMPDDEVHELATEWLQSNGRSDGEQPREVSNWINNAKEGLANGTFQPSDDYRSERLLEVIPEPEDAVDTQWRGGLDRTEDGRIKTTQKNVTDILYYDDDTRGCVAFNSHSQTIGLVKPAPWWPLKGKVGPHGTALTDADLNQFGYWFATKYRIEPAPSKFLPAFDVVARRHPYNPVHDFILQEKWDGVSRIDTVLQDIFGAEADPQYLAACARTLFIGAVARAFRPGCKMDQMPIFEGEQGIRKSTALSILGQAFFRDDLGGEIGSKDVVESIRHCWIIEIPELDSMNKTETNRFKAFLTRRVDRVRISYARLTEDYDRQCIFVGTTNNRDYLRDESGGRRFLPIPCWGKTEDDPIDTDTLEKIVGQLWAEAYVRFSKGEPWWTTDKEISKKATEMQASRRQADPWEATVVEWLEGKDDSLPDGKGKPVVRTYANEIWEKALGGDARSCDRLTSIRISSIMRSLGWTHKTIRISGAKFKGYQRPGVG